MLFYELDIGGSEQQRIIDGMVDSKIKSFNNSFNLKFDRNNIDRLIRLIRKGRIRANTISAIRQFVESAEKLFPGKWDIQFTFIAIYNIRENTYGSNHSKRFRVFDKYVLDSFCIILHFPLFTITNSKRHSHEIRDLFVKVPISYNLDEDKLTFHTIHGIRTTVTTIEHKLRYFHSHLPSANIDHLEYKKFCTGTGDIAATKALLNSESELNINMFELLLLQIEPYIEWESLDGGPYKEITNLVEENPKILDIDTYTRASIFSYFSGRLSEGWTPDLDWEFKLGRYSIIDNEKFEDSFRDIVPIDDNKYNSGVFVYRDERKKYFRRAASLNELVGVRTSWIPFRNEKIYFKIIPEVTKVIDKTPYINPQIKSYVKQQLEFRANYAKTREAGIEKYSRLVHS